MAAGIKPEPFFFTSGLPTGSPAIPGLWAYLAAALKLQQNPFGTDPHGLIEKADLRCTAPSARKAALARY